MSGSTVLAKKVFTELLLTRTRYADEFKRSRLPKSSRQDFHAFLDCAYLADVDGRLGLKREKSPLLFHHLLSSASPTYKRVFQLSLDLEIPFRSVIKSHSRFRLEFDPLAGGVEYPLIKDELYWLVSTSAKKVSHENLERYLGLLVYSFPFFHDLLHAVLNALIPFSDASDLRDYLYFIEAMVLPLEGLVNVELGHDLYNVMATTGALWARPLPGNRNKVEVETDFQKALAENLHQKSNYPTDWSLKWMPEYLKRARKAKKIRLPGACPHTRFKVSDCSAQFFESKPAVTRDLWRWYRSTFISSE